MSRAHFFRRASLRLVSCVGLTLVACSAQESPRPLLAERCLPIEGGQPLRVRVVPDADGTFRISVEPRGISVLASVMEAEGAHRPVAGLARSPVERYGVITFAPALRANVPIEVVIRSHDSPQIVGEACVSAAHLNQRDASTLRAEKAFAAAGEAVQAEDAQRALGLYRVAAREFGGHHALRRAQARNAVAELSYAKIRNDEGAYVLANWALADFGAHADPGLRSSLIALQARTLLESQAGDANERRARVYRLLQSAQALAERAPFGAREIPRFDTLRGFMEYGVGRVPEAAALFEKAARECEALRDWECFARARQNSASLAEERRDFTVALQAYADALRVLPPDLKPQLTADIWSNYGRLQAAAGLLRQSEQAHRKSIQLHAAIGNCEGTRMGLARLGMLLVQVGSIAEGRTYLGQASSLECRNLLALARQEADASSARETETPERETCAPFTQADPLSAGDKLALFNAVLGLREAFRLENEDARSRRCLAAAAAYADMPRLQLRLANAEGTALLEAGRVDNARKTFARGLALADEGKVPATYEHRGPAYSGLARAALLQSRPRAARDYAERALMLGSARADVGQIVESLRLLARSASDERSTAAAAAILRTATGLIEQVPIDDLDAEQRATWLATQHAAFSELTHLYAAGAVDDDARAWQAFDVSERGRARSIRYAENQTSDMHADSAGDSASERYHELMQRIASLSRPSPSASPLPPPPQAFLAALSEIATATAATTGPVDASALQERLKSLDATVVEYAVGRDNLFAFVIDSEHIRVLPLASRSDIATAAGALYENLRNPEAARSDLQATARRLAALAWWPLAAHVRHRRVILVPDDSLHTVPFAVLPWSDAGNAPMLLERAELTVMPSTLFVTRGHPQLSGPRGIEQLELIGDPVFRTADWRRECAQPQTRVSATKAAPEGRVTRGERALPRLPGSRKEVAAIEALARESSPLFRVHSWLGCQATPRTLREAAAASPTLIHIATHGYVDAYRPRLSALALTPDADSNGRGGRFGLLDILDMKIDSRLVVLSACDTSRGRLLPGEGVLGPAQAFLQAGAQSVVASYWRIADEATAPFMQAFYRYLLMDHLSAAAALRQAQLDFARSGSPHDWAAFTLYGWPDTSL